MAATIIQDEDSTVLEFTKLLVEEGEIPINGTGSNFFLIAHGTDGNELGYHGTTGRASFSVTLSPCMMTTMMMHKENATIMADMDMEMGMGMGDDEDEEVGNGQGPATVVRTIANSEIEKPKSTSAGTTMESNVGTSSEHDSSSGNPDSEVTAGTIWAATSGVRNPSTVGRYMFVMISTLAAYVCI